MINIKNRNSSVPEVKELISSVAKHITITSGGKIKYFNYGSDSKGRLLYNTDPKDKDEILKYKANSKEQLLYGLQVLANATIENNGCWRDSYLDMLKNKCYKYLEIVMNLPKGEIS
jgi:hypothetical protein